MKATISLNRLVISCWVVFLILMSVAIMNRDNTGVVGWICAMGILTAVLVSYILVLAGRVKN